MKEFINILRRPTKNILKLKSLFEGGNFLRIFKRCGKSYPQKGHNYLLKKWKAKKKWDKNHPIRAKLKNIWWWFRHGIWQKIEATPRNIKWFIQRGRRGYADCDVWHFDGYLARVISEGIGELIENDVHGHPTDLKNSKQWKSILKKIKNTFETEEKIINCELNYIPESRYSEEQRKEIIKVSKEWKKKRFSFYGDYPRIMTKKENKKHGEGWELFQKYFTNLWD